MRVKAPEIANRASRLKLHLAADDTTLLELMTGFLHVLWALHVLVVLGLHHAGIFEFDRLPGSSRGLSGPMYAFMPLWGWIVLRGVVGSAVCWYALTSKYTHRWVCSIADAVVWALVGGLFTIGAPAIPAGTMLFVLSAVSFHVTYRLSLRFFTVKRATS